MKKALHPFLWALVSCLVLLTAPQASATHILGGDLTYIHLGNTGNLYRVKFRFYRDCSGTTADNWDLTYRNSANCNASATTVRMNPVGASTTGAPYCAGMDNSCTRNSPNPNFELTTYQVDLTLAPGVWSLIIYDDGRSRPNIANLLNEDRTAFNCSGSKNEMFLEATLDNSGGIFNSSPQWDPQDLVVQYVGLNQSSTITYSATETDGDSLVYEMVQPYDRCGVPIPYAPYTGGGNTGGTVMLRNGCTLTLPPAFTNFSTAVPLPVALDTLGTCPNRTARPAFYFNSAARTITFTPNYYNPAGTANCGYNKYQIVMRISEYRRIGGVRRLVGTVRREGVIVVLNSTNHVPGPPVAAHTNPISPAGPPPTNRPDSLEVRIYAGNYGRVRLDFRDPDPGDPLKVTYPIDINTNPAYLDNGNIGTFTLVGNNGTHPVGTFILQPSRSAIGRVVRINLRAEDNSCPVKGVQNRVLIIRVLGGNFARIAATTAGGTPVPPPFLSCTGSSSLTLNGSIQRPDSVYLPAPITPASQKTRQVYTYQWSLLRGDGFVTAAQATNQSINVNPTMTSRYRLTVTSTLGFGGINQDTTSVLVRVAPTGTNGLISKLVSSGVHFSTTGDSLALPPATFRLKGTAHLTSASTDFRIDSVRWTQQRVKDGKGNAVTEPETVFSRNLASPADLVLRLPGQYRVVLHAAITLISAPGQTPVQCPLPDAVALLNVAEINTPNVITPNNDGFNDAFRVSPELAGSKLQIYNRWGRKVEEFASYNNDWVAKDQGPGTYFYAITDVNGNVTKGWVEVIK